MRVEKLLNSCSSSFDRHKLIERIRELSMGKYLFNFVWNKMTVLDGGDCISDSQLIASLFFSFLELVAACEDKNQPFDSTLSYLSADAKLPMKSHYFLVRQQSRNPPAFQFIADNVMYENSNARLSLFNSIVYLVAYSRRHSGSYIGMTNIEGRSIQLSSILQ